jgi:hypothetical protein
MADTTILRCAYAEIVTSTNGNVQSRKGGEIIKLGDNIYQLWSTADAEWSGNRCAFAKCQSNSKEFLYSSDSNTPDNGYVERYMETLTFDRASGGLMAETKNSTTFDITGYEIETTIFGDGQCEKISDPTLSSEY